MKELSFWIDYEMVLAYYCFKWENYLECFVDRISGLISELFSDRKGLHWVLNKQAWDYEMDNDLMESEYNFILS